MAKDDPAAGKVLKSAIDADLKEVKRVLDNGTKEIVSVAREMFRNMSSRVDSVFSEDTFKELAEKFQKKSPEFKEFTDKIIGLQGRIDAVVYENKKLSKIETRSLLEDSKALKKEVLRFKEAAKSDAELAAGIEQVETALKKPLEVALDMEVDLFKATKKAGLFRTEKAVELFANLGDEIATSQGVKDSLNAGFDALTAVIPGASALNVAMRGFGVDFGRIATKHTGKWFESWRAKREEVLEDKLRGIEKATGGGLKSLGGALSKSGNKTELVIAETGQKTYEEVKEVKKGVNTTNSILTGDSEKVKSLLDETKKTGEKAADIPPTVTDDVAKQSEEMWAKKEAEEASLKAASDKELADAGITSSPTVEKGLDAANDSLKTIKKETGETAAGVKAGAAESEKTTDGVKALTVTSTEGSVKMLKFFRWMGTWFKGFGKSGWIDSVLTRALGSLGGVGGIATTLVTKALPLAYLGWALYEAGDVFVRGSKEFSASAKKMSDEMTGTSVDAWTSTIKNGILHPGESIGTALRLFNDRINAAVDASATDADTRKKNAALNRKVSDEDWARARDDSKQFKIRMAQGVKMNDAAVKEEAKRRLTVKRIVESEGELRREQLEIQKENRVLTRAEAEELARLSGQTTEEQVKKSADLYEQQMIKAGKIPEKAADVTTKAVEKAADAVAASAELTTQTASPVTESVAKASETLSAVPESAVAVPESRPAPLPMTPIVPEIKWTTPPPQPISMARQETDAWLADVGQPLDDVRVAVEDQSAMMQEAMNRLTTSLAKAPLGSTGHAVMGPDIKSIPVIVQDMGLILANSGLV